MKKFSKIIQILLAAAIYASFFALVGWSVYFLRSGWPLLALLITPNVKIKSE